jgi:hypothetical protein
MAKTLGECITSIRDRLDETDARAWTDAQLRRWVNEGVRDVARQAEVLQTTEDIAVSGGTQEYLMPADVVRVYRVEWRPDGETSVYPLDYMDFHEMDQVWNTSQSTSGTPAYYTMWGYPPSLNMILYPTPAVGGAARVFYYRVPANLETDGTDDAEDVSVPEGWEDLLIDYAEYHALRKDRDPRWQEARALYLERLGNMYDITRRWSDQAGTISVGRSHLPRWLWDET